MSKALTLAGAALAFVLYATDALQGELAHLNHDRHRAILQIGE